MANYGYVRISTTKQEEGLGREIQEERIQVWCKARGLEPAEIHMETMSGEKLLEREVFQSLRQKMVKGDRFIVYRLDRLSRLMVAIETLLFEFHERGILVCSTQPEEAHWLDPERFNDPQNKFMRQIMGAVAEYDRALQINRMQAGNKAKATRDGWSRGSVPIGYRANAEKKLEIVPEMIPVIRTIIRLVDDGNTYSDTARQMAASFDQCRNWTHADVRRVFIKRKLYERGEWEGKDGVVALPELKML